jgi:MFS transporter, DHA1 family, multidrug resistance protein
MSIPADLYLPALPTITQAFGAPISAAQPVLLGGLALYTVASVLSAVAPSIGWLIAWRALQGLAMAAAVIFGIAVAAIAWTLVQRHGEVRPVPIVQPA